MVDYSIAAIPTEYRGRTYRSRLEARWAAFFDRLGLAHEYEPFDLGGWSPDFLLPEINTLVEIKPLTEFDRDVWAKMVDACNERGLLSGDNQINALLLSMVAPRKIEAPGEFAHVGWMGLPWHDPTMEPIPAYVAWVDHETEPRYLADFSGYHNGIILTTSDAVDLRTLLRQATNKKGAVDLFSAAVNNVPETYTDYVMEQWARATSDVQWRPDEKA